MADDKLLDRIQKLINLGESPNPHEAASAMAMAQRLMAEHNLSGVDVEASKLGHVRIKSPFSVSKPKDFENFLAWGVAKAFGCHLLWQAAHSRHRDIYGKFIFVGPKSALTMVEHFFVVLQRRLLTGRAEFVRTLAGQTAKRKTLEGNGWCWGYVKEVRQALHEVALAVSQDALDRYYRDNINYDPEGVKARDSKAGYLGHTLGAEAGKAERLHRPMTTSARERIAS